jgi:formylglycine-generating enzyme
MAKIFISYRRDDTAGIVGRIDDHLRARFGKDAVFIDVDSVPLGVDFQKHIASAVSQCDLVLAVIGTNWVGETGAERRIDDPEDFVRIEIEAALNRDIPVIPILIDHTPMPTKADLPPSLARLTYRNATNVDQGRDFHPNVDRLVKGIEFHLRQPTNAIVKPPGETALRLAESKLSSPSGAKKPTNSVGMSLVRIEPGEFLMGSTKSQIKRLLTQFPNAKSESFDAEQPQHRVKITRSFYLGAHQVTVAQFRQFVEKSGYLTDAERTGEGSGGWEGAEWKRNTHRDWRNPGFAQADDHPVVCVNHNDALAFLEWLNAEANEEKWNYRLPTEAQWEYACRAGTDGLYGSNDDVEGLARIANVADASHKKVFPHVDCIRGDDGFVYTAPVGLFEPNSWHLCDMIGNVWEWCDDWFDPQFYESSPHEDPHNTARSSSRVIRGGGWSYAASFCRPADRRGKEASGRDYVIGFRVAAFEC